MRIGVVKEIKAREERVGLTPAGAAELVRAGNTVMVKEPIAPEYGFLRKDLTLFTYLHLAADRALTEALLDAGTLGIAYETVADDPGLPLLPTMSEIAGRL